MKKDNIEFLSGLDSILSSKFSKSLWIIPFLIGSFFLCLILWLSLSQVDVIAPSQGKTIPSSRMIYIQPKETSIVKKVFVKNGQRVKKGEILLEFQDNMETIDNNGIKIKYQIALSKKLYYKALIDYIKEETKVDKIETKELLSSFLKRINSELESSIFSFDTEVSSLKMKIEKISFEKKMIETEFQKQLKILPYIEYKLTQMKSLVSKGLESEIILKDLEKEYIERQQNIKIKKEEKSKLNTQLKIAKKELSLFKSNTLEEYIKKYSEVSNEIESLIPDLQRSNYLLQIKTIIAPQNGEIYNLKNITEGKVLQSGEVIMEIIPEKSPLEVEAKVLNRDIGFINVGQKVKVKIDSFKFTKYGYIQGVITNIEKSSILDENLGEVYPIIVELSTNKMKIDDKYVTLKPGMTCSVDIKIGKRRLIEYIISPMIRYKDEALKEK